MRYLNTLMFLALWLASTNSYSQKDSTNKTALVQGVVTDFEKNIKVGEIIIFENTETTQTYETISNDQGKFTAELPYSYTYQIKIKGFNEDIDYTKFSIPGLQEGQNRLNYEIEIKFKPSTTFTLSNVNFESGKATLTKESYKQLKDLLEFMKLKKLTNIEIAGHTDDIGPEDANLILSQKRADAVKNFLISNGIDTKRVTAVGYGEFHPISSNDSNEGRQSNRRTEVRILE